MAWILSKGQQRAVAMIDFNDENWYSVLQQKLDLDVDVGHVDQGFCLLINRFNLFVDIGNVCLINSSPNSTPIPGLSTKNMGSR
jgi:hypothetical protein